MLNGQEIMEMDAKQFASLPAPSPSERLTYSKNFFIPLTNACRNSCGYCSFNLGEPYLLGKRKVVKRLEEGKRRGCLEALFTLGERPEEVPEVARRLKKEGYSGTLEYTYDLCNMALEMGLLPHTNLGIVSYEELKMLGEVNSSLGLMLESTSSRLLQPGMPHQHSPGKEPSKRLKVIENAGKSKIPFTTGVLVGIGEEDREVAHSLEEIEKLYRKHGHIQEVIVQNFQPKRGTPMEAHSPPGIFRMLKAVRAAREVLSSPVQIPPNLNSYVYPIFVLYGASDLGGVSPYTRDYINPEKPWPELEELSSIAGEMGVELRERLPIHPPYIKKGWYSSKVGEVIDSYTDEEGLVRNG